MATSLQDFGSQVWGESCSPESGVPRHAGTAHGCHSGHPNQPRKCPPALGFLMERWWDFTKCLFILCQELLACKGVQEGGKANEGNVFTGLVSWFSFPLCSGNQWLRQWGARIGWGVCLMEGDELWCCCPSMSHCGASLWGCWWLGSQGKSCWWGWRGGKRAFYLGCAHSSSSNTWENQTLIRNQSFAKQGGRK